MPRGLLLLLLVAAVTAAAHEHKRHRYKMARDVLFVGWDSFEEQKPKLWTNIEECEQAREQCYILRDCKDDSKCLGELKYEPTSVETSLGLKEDKPDNTHDRHPCAQLIHYCYGIDKTLYKRVINKRIYWQYSFEHNLNQA
ncbi:hypothetical protein PENTCL1PPCAC_19933 [Pristionchus entomophagus]|uniref:Uncharacterized protein n=1 Tax=Pristionchus entomophagus TaxID=358040 RepID=A0AAV5TUR5_9BILA|nr:hypothetical protein PENTCL1PPCAC_19933 [Pristionchus entomophagus]